MRSLGITHEELAIARSNGISTDALIHRMRMGWDKQDAITLPLKRAWRVEAINSKSIIQSGLDYVRSQPRFPHVGEMKAWI